MKVNEWCCCATAERNAKETWMWSALKDIKKGAWWWSRRCERWRFLWWQDKRWGQRVSEGMVRWGTNLCKHSHRPVLPRHCGSSPACIAGSAAPLCCAYSSHKWPCLADRCSCIGWSGRSTRSLKVRASVKERERKKRGERRDREALELLLLRGLRRWG